MRHRHAERQMMTMVEFGKPPACLVLGGTDQPLVGEPSERCAETLVTRLSGGDAVVAWRALIAVCIVSLSVSA